MSVDAFRELARERLDLPVPEFHSRWLEGQLMAISRQWGYPDEDSLIVALRSLEGSSELWRDVIHAITVHETSWLRNSEPLKQAIAAFGSHLSDLRILSLGCAYGQEAYAAFLIARDIHPGASIEVEGIDLSPRCIEAARSGRYPLTPDFKDVLLYLRDGDGEIFNAYYQFSEIIRSKVSFRTGNALDLWVGGHASFDLILCQNCLTYYEQSVREQVASNLVDSLEAGGLLVFAGAELLGARPKGSIPLSDEWPQIFVKEF